MYIHLRQEQMMSNTYIHTLHTFKANDVYYIPYIHTYIHTYHTYIRSTCIHTIHTYIHTYIHTIHTYIHTYIHTHTHGMFSLSALESNFIFFLKSDILEISCLSPKYIVTILIIAELLN